MKKIVLGITAIATSVVIGSIVAAAAPGIGFHNTLHKTDSSVTQLVNTSQSDTFSSSACKNYIDTNGDGICDNCHSNNCTAYNAQIPNTTPSDSSSSSACQNYIDTDGDGICDNCHFAYCRTDNTCNQSHHSRYGHSNSNNGYGYHNHHDR